MGQESEKEKRADLEAEKIVRSVIGERPISPWSDNLEKLIEQAEKEEVVKREGESYEPRDS